MCVFYFLFSEIKYYRSKMNMKLPAYLQDEVENLVPFGNEDLDFSEFEWMADQELEEFDRQV